MTIEPHLHTQYDDILEEGDDRILLQVVRDLEAIYPPRRPPVALYARMAASLECHGQERKGHRLIGLPTFNFGVWKRGRVALAGVVLALISISLGTSGIAAAAIHAVQTQLFSAPPPSPQAAVWVGSPEPPLRGGCALHSVSSPVAPPDARSFAQLDTVPGGFTTSVAAIFPPCMVRPLPTGVVPPKQPANLAWENITTVSVVRYEGTNGELEVVTARATGQGMRRGLYLGNPVGTLADGSPAFTLTRDVRWLEDGLIISVSGDLPLGRLKEIAADVAVK